MQTELLHKIVLHRISSSHQNLRTDLVLGETPSLPVIGQPFVVYSEPLDPTKSVRTVFTTPVQEMTALSNGAVLFRTLNSTYCVKPVEGS